MLSKEVLAMSIHYAILGILSYQSLTGYDIKKVMQESPFMYWSGNNNQIYKALVELHDKGLITGEVCHQNGSPSKKVYSIAPSGLAELKKWSLTMPEAQDSKNAFLVQLAWTWQLSYAELDALLEEYQREVTGRLALTEHKGRTGGFFPDRTPRERAVWRLISENVAGAYRQELSWIANAREVLREYAADESPYENGAQSANAGDDEPPHALIEKNGESYLYLGPADKRIETERDGLDLISLCAQYGVNRLMIDAERLSDDFFRLATGLAGAVLQKFAQYNIKAAVVLNEHKIKGRFVDFVKESNRGDQFRACQSKEEAENWLLSGRG